MRSVLHLLVIWDSPLRRVTALRRAVTDPELWPQWPGLLALYRHLLVWGALAGVNS